MVMRKLKFSDLVNKKDPETRSGTLVKENLEACIDSTIFHTILDEKLNHIHKESILVIIF